MSYITKHGESFITAFHLSIAYMGTPSTSRLLSDLPSEFNIYKHDTLEELEDYLDNQSILTLPDVMLIETDSKGECFDFIKKIKKNPFWRELIIVLIASEENKSWKSTALQLKVHDFYVMPFPSEHLIQRLHFLVKFKLIKPQLSVLENVAIIYKLPLLKRTFDIAVSSICILLLSPILIITAILIRLDSKGSIIYKSKRVGTGYDIFDFYKFRSMHIGTENQLEDLSDMNGHKTDGDESDDPRIIRFGSFIRRTSIDELPQLFNVLKGNMSLVGNRPLSLYEAEMLTSNEWSQRLIGPAGVTGLWQIKSRGKRDISELERKKFDNFYSCKYSFWLDLEILIKTLIVKLYKVKF